VRQEQPFLAQPNQRLPRAAQLPKPRKNHLDGLLHLRCGTLRHPLPGSGVDLVTLKRLLGHSKLATTANYLHVSQQRLDTIQSPLDRITLNLPSIQS
jgi:integrase